MGTGLLTNGYICPPGGLSDSLVVVVPTMSAIHNLIRKKIGNIDFGAVPCLIQYDNAPFIKPKKTHWIRAEIKTLESKQVMFGSKRTYRTAGITRFQLFAPIEIGDGGMNEISDIIMDNFRAINVSGIRFRTPFTGDRKRFDSEWMILINCPFQADQVG